jgi:cytochrome c-type biogenesis protein CcmH
MVCRPLAFTFALVLVTGCAAPPAPSPAVRVERRLLAPCCWNQTLDIHESELASSLRSEIRARVARGESAEAIERVMVDRYGERIRAAPAQRDPLLGIAIAVSALFALIALALIARGRRSLRGSAAQTVIATSGREPTYDERIERELRALDDET